MILNGVKFRAVLAALLVFTCGATAFAQNSGTPGLHTVVIDPGHGGKDPGAISKDKKSHEKAFVLDISKRLKEKIEAACPDVKVLLTRSDDTYIPLIDRAKYATRNNADVFISVHINASDRSTSVNGYSVHLLGPSDKSKNTYAYNMEVCKRENEVILLEDDYTTTYQGFDPNDPESDIFLHLMHNAYREQSLLFAQIVDNHLKSGPFKKSNGIYQNNFAVLRLATMPAMLLELGFISSTNDLTTLRNKDSRDNLATRLCDAFCEYKKLYDESVGATSAADASNAVAKSASAVVEPVETTEQTSTSGISTSSIVYATQILATTVRKNSADPIFLGYTPLEIKSGRLYKYYIGVSPDVSKAKEYFRTISKTYSDAFVVKVVDGTATRVQ
jgi:N-acetylmuramoyl-L-alanine amidase